jgi:hypothetical protein
MPKPSPIESYAEAGRQQIGDEGLQVGCAIQHEIHATVSARSERRCCGAARYDTHAGLHALFALKVQSNQPLTVACAKPGSQPPITRFRSSRENSLVRKCSGKPRSSAQRVGKRHFRVRVLSPQPRSPVSCWSFSSLDTSETARLWWFLGGPVRDSEPVSSTGALDLPPPLCCSGGAAGLRLHCPPSRIARRLDR